MTKIMYDKIVSLVTKDYTWYTLLVQLTALENSLLSNIPFFTLIAEFLITLFYNMAILCICGALNFTHIGSD